MMDYTSPELLLSDLLDYVEIPVRRSFFNLFFPRRDTAAN